MRKHFILFIFLLMSTTIFSLHPHVNFKHPIPKGKYYLSKADSAHGFDMQKYVITLSINDENEYIQGNVRASVTALENMTHIQYELEEFSITNVLVNDETADFTYMDGVIDIQIGNIQAGDTFTTQVFYEGYPSLSDDGYDLGMFFGDNYVMTLVDPSGARWWWPCYDHPWDKAITDLHITMRDDWLVASNGIRQSIVDNNDGTKTHNWIGQYPIATYLVVITAADYTELNQEYNGLPIQNFVSPLQYQAAQVTLSNLPFMIQVYSQEYGDYPFEKYGNAVSPISLYSAMEHQTMTTLGNFIITGDHQYETTIAHELSHHWFGDCLTPLTWKDVWLSESFATYSEAVYTHHWQGWQAAINYVNGSFHNYYLNWAGANGPHTIYDPDYLEYFSPPSYEKGASVLHMLRLKYGGDVFFNILRTYFQTFKYGNVVTQDFIDICQQVTGDDLTQFFDQWIFKPGTPEVNYCYFTNSQTNEIKIFAETYANADNQFFLDIPAQINYSTASDSVLCQATPNQPFSNTFSLSDTPVSLQIDPNHWVLTRSYNHKSLSLQNVLAGNNQVTIMWNDFWDEVSISGYNLYKSTQENGEYVKINQQPVVGTSYQDTNVTNGETYYYKVCAVTNDNFESEFSDICSVTPIDFPLNQGILVIDETADGNGTILHPTDEAVDAFYNDVISTSFTSYDYATQGQPSLSYIVNYSTVIWHDDDFSLSSFKDNIENLSSYLLGGGNLIVSGCKTAQNVSNNFFQTFFPNMDIDQISSFTLNTATSTEYQDLHLDDSKIPTSFDSALPFVTTFNNTQNGIYTLTSVNGSEWDGSICGIKTNLDGNLFVFLGFPLYYFEQTDVSLFMNQILTEIGESNSHNEIISVNKEINVYPNPFNPETKISFVLKNAEQVKITIYNLKGEKIKTLLNDYFKAGSHSVVWNGTDENSKDVSSGVYFIKMKTSSANAIVKKCLLLK